MAQLLTFHLETENINNMIRNYFKTAIRNIGRNKLFTFLNILGLSLGLSTAILILFWVQDELSYDKFNKDYKNIIINLP